MTSIDRTDYNLKGLQTVTGVFDPEGTGEYNITVNGQKLCIKVTDPSNIPEVPLTTLVEDFEDGDLTPVNSNWNDWQKGLPSDGGSVGVRNKNNINGSYLGSASDNNGTAYMWVQRKTPIKPDSFELITQVGNLTEQKPNWGIGKNLDLLTRGNLKKVLIPLTCSHRLECQQMVRVH